MKAIVTSGDSARCKVLPKSNQCNAPGMRNSCDVQGEAVPMWWDGTGTSRCNPTLNGVGNRTNELETTQCCGNDFLVALVY